jgi:hypothetical protein
MGLMVRCLALVLICMAMQPVLAQTCTVYDPELRGSYNGPCNAEGRAEGRGTALGQFASYQGQFVNGAKHGSGTKTWLATGDRYVGEFLNDHRHGRGQYTWGVAAAGKPQERYTGDFDRDRRHGWGRFEWLSGDAYEGPWANDLQSGPLTPMQQIKRKHADSLAKAIAQPGKELCLVADAKQRVVVVGYANGMLTAHATGAVQNTFASQMELWRRC